MMPVGASSCLRIYHSCIPYVDSLEPSLDPLGGELIDRFTHTIEMDWILPGILPTGRRVEVAVVVVVQFREGKIASEHIY